MDYNFNNKRFAPYRDETSGVGGKNRPTTYGVYDNKNSCIYSLSSAKTYEEAQDQAIALNKKPPKEKPIKPVPIIAKSPVTVYETGATSEVVNEFILYIDTTRELSELKYLIFQRVKETEHLFPSSQHPDMGKILKVDLGKSLGVLYKKAKALYIKEFPTPDLHDHIKFIGQPETEEFFSLYKEAYKAWRKEQDLTT